MITGYDTVLISSGPAAGSIEEFFRRWSQRWPSMLLAIEGVAESRFLEWESGVTRLPTDTAEILVARDQAMAEDWDAEGYHLSADGEGPFAVYYGPCPASRLRILALEDPYQRHEYGFDPYEALLVGPALSLVTTVTPDGESAFSRQVVEEMATCLGGRTS
jgi:hypothetical protein